MQNTGRTALIPEWAVERLKQELLEPEGFSSYEEVRLWLAAELGIQYDVVHNLVHEKADKKVARPKAARARARRSENFKKELAQKLTSVFKVKKQSKKFKSAILV